MATLPTIPTFSFQEVPSLTKLNQLASAVSFVTQVPIVASLKRGNSDQSITANTNTAVIWDTSEVDSDGMNSLVTNPSRLTCKTQGYYRFHATIAMSNTGSANLYHTWFVQTTGSNNPLGAGVTQVFGGEVSSSDATSTDTISLSIRSLTPCLYVNDYVEVNVGCSAAVSVVHHWRSSGNLDNAGNDDGASCVYAYYAFEGP